MGVYDAAILEGFQNHNMWFENPQFVLRISIFFRMLVTYLVVFIIVVILKGKTISQ